MANHLPQRCALAFIYIQVIAYFALAGFLAVTQRFGMMAVWVLAAPIAIYAYVRSFPRISRWMGYGSVSDAAAADPPKVATRVTLYTAIGCPFCPIMEERLRTLRASMEFQLEVVDVTARPELARRKRIGAVPMIEVEDRRHAGCMTTQELAALIATPATSEAVAPALHRVRVKGPSPGARRRLRGEEGPARRGPVRGIPDSAAGESAVEPSATSRDWGWTRAVRLGLGTGMALVAGLTMRHFYEARFPTSIADAAACRADSFFNCASSALSPVAVVHGVPIAYFGFMLGALVVLGAITPSGRLERTTRVVVLLNALLALLLFLYSLLWLRSLCLTCSAYTLLALVAGAAFWPWRGRGADDRRAAAFAVSVPHLVAFGAATLVGAYGVSLYGNARAEARTGDAAARVVHQYFALDTVPAPSTLSPYWSTRSTARFEDAPIRIVQFGDLLCSDCRFFAAQMRRLAPEFPGQINAAFQFFPLEARCNDVVTKDKHPGACDLAYIAAYRPDLFPRIHDEVFAHPAEAKDPAWRARLARRYGVQAALTDSATHALVRRIIRTGVEYERTSGEYAHGIRSTPTLIVNGRMIIGTLPDEQMRAIFQAIVDQRLGRGKRFIEHWVD